MMTEETKTKNEAAIRELIDRFAKAFRFKDVDGCMSIFAPGIVSFDILPPPASGGGREVCETLARVFRLISRSDSRRVS